MDQLILEGVEIWLRVGCTEAERAFPQRIELDLTLELPLAHAGKEDNLSATIDYAQVVDLVKKTLEQKSFKLAEAVAEQTAELLLWKHKLAAVTVRVKKRALPGLAWAGVQIRRPL
jgi:FolB domain-containing protein